MFERNPVGATDVTGAMVRRTSLSTVVLWLAVIAIIVLGTLPAPLSGLIALVVGRVP